MKIRRGLFDKHKQNVWLINISVDKYIWIKKPKYIINKIGKILLSIITLPFMILWTIIVELLDLVKEMGCVTWEWIKDTVGDFIDIFPTRIEITDEKTVVDSEFRNPNINSKQK